jgi:hypothetical protein
MEPIPRGIGFVYRVANRILIVANDGIRESGTQTGCPSIPSGRRPGISSPRIAAPSSEAQQ